jgi:hypothetical protein
MSIWTNVEGTIEINQNAKVSIKTLATEIFGEISFGNMSQNKHVSRNTIIHIINFAFASDGMDAAAHIRKFVDAIRQYDKGAVVELEASIRFF